MQTITRKRRLALAAAALALALCGAAALTASAAEGGVPFLSSSAAQVDAGEDPGCYISGLKIKSAEDGTAPFDGDDERGNDSAKDNGIVRTFDYVNYNVEYTTALENEWQTIDSADVDVEVSIDFDPKQASFNTETLNWCLNRSIIYVYADGSTSTTWDESKEVVKQVLTGTRHIENTSDSNAIPGAGTLSVGIYVQAARNGDVVTPSFKLKVAGNEEKKAQSVTADPITVSAEPRYNVKLQRYTQSMSRHGYFDLEAGTVSREDSEGAINGRQEGYGLTLQLYNTSANKGLRGVELPQGDISFDLTVSTTLDGKDVSDAPDWSPVLWDYRDNTSSTALNKKGVLGRNMAPYETTQSYLCWSAPYNNATSSRETSCPGGGTFTITPDAADRNVLHVSLSGYTFDYKDFTFPTNNPGNATGTVVYPANVGCFSVGYVQFVAQFPRAVESTQNLYFNAEVSNFKATSLSDTDVTEDVNKVDNKSTFKVTLYAPGTIDKYVQFSSVPGGRAQSVWNAGDSYGPLLSKTTVANMLTYTGDEPVTACNLLLKFDTDGFEVPAGTTSHAKYSCVTVGSTVGSVKTLFAAKPDKTGWASDEEMNLASEENLVYFDTIDELTDAGYTCVGILHEARDCRIYGGRDSALYVYDYLKVRDAAVPGTVYSVVNDMRAWKTSDAVPVWEDHAYEGDASYGLGDAGMERKTYADWYTAPAADVYRSYVKSSYEDGTLSGGHKGGVRWGDSLLIVGAKNTVKITVADKSGNTSKSVYDLDAGERTVNYAIQPTLTLASSSGENTSAGLATDLVVKALLPKDLHYQTGTASLAPESVVENDDGTSTITWIVPDVEVGSAVDPITFGCTIGAAGTAEDVHNNDAITIEATVTSDLDSRKVNVSNGNKSDTTIHVVRLAASAVSKSVDAPLTELNKDNMWTLHFGNSSEEVIQNARLFDVLPYDGDPRGSAFSGDYRIASIEIDFASAPKALERLADRSVLYGTASESARNAKANEVLNGTSDITWDGLGAPVLDGTKLIWSGLGSKKLTALYLAIGDLPEHEYLTINLHHSSTDATGNPYADADGNTQQPGDVYVNSFSEYADNQAAVVASNNAIFQVVERNLSGYAWFDADKDGEMEADEERLDGVTATLYRTDPSVFGGKGIEVQLRQDVATLYPAYDVLGDEVSPVETDGDGAYRFEKLEAGTYYVVFSGDELSEYTLTVKDAAADTVDSDCDATLDEADHVLSSAYLERSLPDLADMTEALYESTNNSAGFAPYSGSFGISKHEAGTDTPLGGVSFVMKDAQGSYLCFEDGVCTGAAGALSDSSLLLSSEDGSVRASGIGIGRYELSEHEAPEGYEGASSPWTVEVAPDAAYSADGVAWNTTVTFDGAEFQGDILDVPNTPKMTSVEFTKTWDDDHDRDGLRQDATFVLTGTITAGGSTETVITKSFTVTREQDASTIHLTSLPAYHKGALVSYHIEETAVEGYDSTVSEASGSWDEGYSITADNAYSPATIDIPVAKTWDDQDDRDGLRPDAVKVTLTGSDGSVRELEISAEGGWSGTFEDLPVYHDHGKAIEYSLAEAEVDGYETDVVRSPDGYGFAVTNTHETAKCKVTAVKVWDDVDDQDGLRPDSVTVTLSGSDGSVREAAVTEADGWEASFDDLPVYFDHGERIDYSLTEDAVSGYEADITEDEGRCTFILTNAHKPVTRSISVTKTWDDDDDRDGLRPDSITVTLSGSDGSVREAAMASIGEVVTFEDLPVYHDGGKKIEYTLSEQAVDGYEAAVSGNADGSKLTLTNKHVPATRSIPVTKTWDDDGDRDGLRPESVEFTLTGSDGSERTLELGGAGWSGSFDDLPVYFNHGVKIEYGLDETTVDGYSSTIAEADGGYEVRNAHDVATTTVHVVKDWSDADNQDGIRPDAIDVTLKGTDGSAREARLSEENGWACDFTGLPVYCDGGVKIEYALSEQAVDGYTDRIVKSDDGCSFTITNEHIPAVVSIPVTKTWDDDGDRDGLRPDSITVTLTGSDGSTYKKTFDAGTGYSGIFDDLPVYHDGGKKVEYNLSEAEVDGYEADVERSPDGYGFAVTNEHIPAVVSIPVAKTWDDDGDRDGLRPDSVTVTLSGSDGSVREAAVTEADGWEASFDDLPVYFDHGERIDYSLTEDAISGYEADVAKGGDGSFTVTNVHEPQAADVPVTKIWDDADDQDGLRPDSVTVTLSGSDGSAYRLELSAGNDWTGAFENLPLHYDHGKRIEYALSEDAVEGYASETVLTDGGGMVTNTHEPETRTIYVNKTWDDDDDRDGLRPDSVTVTLKGSDGSSRRATLTADNGFAASFEDLPAYHDHGKEIKYTLDEHPVEGYEASIVAAENDNLYTVTNVHEPAVLTLGVEKVWDDRADEDGLRPNSITVTLSGSDGSVREAAVTEADGWEASFDDLPVYFDHGERIDYSLTEDAVSGYDADVRVLEDGSGFVVTNSHGRSVVADAVAAISEMSGTLYDKTGVRTGVLAGILGIMMLAGAGAAAYGIRQRRLAGAEAAKGRADHDRRKR